MQLSQKNRFDIFGQIVNGYPTRVFNKASLSRAKKPRLQGIDPLSIVGGLINGYPSKVYKSPAL